MAVAMSTLSLSARAQQTDDYLQRLAEPDTLSGARTEVLIHFSAEEAMDKYNTQTTPKESYQGYRIRIFASNNQTARADAEAAIAVVEENFQIPVYFAYENPYFLVTCGNCLSHEEAIMLLSKVKRHFPKAFIVTSEIPAEELLQKPVHALLEGEAAEGADGAESVEGIEVAAESPEGGENQTTESPAENPEGLVQE